MRSDLRRGVLPDEHHERSPNEIAQDWESVRIFLEVSRHGSFRSCADHLGMSINHLRSRVERLEHQVGAKLLTRHVDGVRPTAEGEEILCHARQMETASLGIMRARARAARSIEGEVKIAVTEGLGTFWLVPRLVEFQRAYPRLVIDLCCAMQSADVLRLQAHAAIQLTIPTSPDLKRVKLGRMHIMLFASRSYIDMYGCPKTYDELLKHRVVFHVADQTRGKEIYDKIFPGVPEPGFLAMRNNVSSAHYWAIAKGAGIGWLPTYGVAIGARIVPLEIDLREDFDIWLTYHADVAEIPRVRKVLDWIIEAFNPREFPWFRDEFIHPNELAKHYDGAPPVNLFEGFSAGSEALSLMKYR